MQMVPKKQDKSSAILPSQKQKHKMCLIEMIK
jgi:hypothetical protein